MTEEGNVAEEKTFSAKQVATRIGTDAKQLRKFFRDSDSGFDAVGQGGRYDFPESMLPEIKQKFDAWASTKTRRNRARAALPVGGAINAAAPTLPAQRQARPSMRPAPRIIMTPREAAEYNLAARQKKQ